MENIYTSIIVTKSIIQDVYINKTFLDSIVNIYKYIILAKIVKKESYFLENIQFIIIV